jgi:hypothetical protein
VRVSIARRAKREQPWAILFSAAADAKCPTAGELLGVPGSERRNPASVDPPVRQMSKFPSGVGTRGNRNRVRLFER